MSVHQKRNSNSKFYLYVPDWFDKTFLSPDFRHLEQEAWYFLHLVIQRHISERIALSEYVPILAELLRLVIPARGLLPRPPELRLPPDYQRLLRDLEANGAIECDHYYEPGVSATGYRLAPQLRGSYHARTVTKPELLKRLTEIDQMKKNQMKHPIHRHLKKWCEKIEIDGPAAQQRLNERSAETGKDYSSNRLAVDKIERGEVDFLVDDFGRRVHTLVSGLNKVLRPYLHYKGQRLVNHDVACSQPFFLALMLLNAEMVKHRKSNPWNMGGILETGKEFSPFSKFKLPEQRKPYSTFLPPISPFSQKQEGGGCVSPYSVGSEFLPHLETSSERTCDEPINIFHPSKSLVRFLQDCASGRLYEVLAIEAKTTREDVKQRLWSELLFCKLKGEQGLAKIVGSIYPTVRQGIRDMKKGTETDRHTVAAMLLQRQESSLIIGRVCLGLMRDHPDIPIWTIHDSILTIPQHSPTVLQAMHDAFAAMGAIPSFRVEDYSSGSTTLIQSPMKF